jgi:hypothetical protein
MERGLSAVKPTIETSDLEMSECDSQVQNNNRKGGLRWYLHLWKQNQLRKGRTLIASGVLGERRGKPSESKKQQRSGRKSKTSSAEMAIGPGTNRE